MSVICIGPVCIPIWGLIPFLLWLLNSLKDRIFGFLSSFKSQQIKKNIKSLPANLRESAATTSILDYEHFVELISKTSGETIFVKFTASWCGPCKKIQPLYERLQRTYGDHLFLVVDTEAVPKLSEEFSIRALPTFVAITNTKEVLATCVGGVEEKLVSFVEKNA